MNAYLSLDLDYWRCFTNDIECRNDILDTLVKIADTNVNIFYSTQHHELLPDIRVMHKAHGGIDVLINKDYHSDITNGIPGAIDSAYMDLNEGTWVNYVPKTLRQNGRYIWVYPDKECLSVDTGYCHSSATIYTAVRGRTVARHTQAPYNPFKHPKLAGWKQTQLRQGSIPQKYWKSIVAVGICCSPDWILSTQGPIILEAMISLGAFKHIVPKLKKDLVKFRGLISGIKRL